MLHTHSTIHVPLSQVLRQYGSFLVNMLNDTAQGHLMLARADEIESQQDRARPHQGSEEQGCSDATSGTMPNLQSHGERGALFADDTGMRQ